MIIIQKKEKKHKFVSSVNSYFDASENSWKTLFHYYMLFPISIIYTDQA
jgi:hypothetical protein